MVRDRGRDNDADRLNNRLNDGKNNVTDRMRDNAGKEGINRDNLDPKLRDQLDRAREKRDGDRNRDLDNVVKDNNRGPKIDVDNKVNTRIRNEGVKPVVVRPDRLDNETRNRILQRDKVVIRDNDKVINLTPINRPGVGNRFGRDNLVDRRVALNGLLHQSHANRNVRYNGRFNDWHAWNGNFYSRHSNWHRGYWNFNRWNGFYGPNWWGFGVGWGRRWGGGWGGWGGGWGGWAAAAGDTQRPSRSA